MRVAVGLMLTAWGQEAHKNIPHDTRPCYEPWLGRALGLLHDVPGYKGLPPQLLQELYADPCRWGA